MAQLPESILLVDSEGDFVVLRDFCFNSHADYVETEVAGHRGVAMFGGTDLVIQFCANEGLLLSVYPLVNPVGELSSSGSSGASTPSWHPPSAQNTPSESASETDVSR